MSVTAKVFLVLTGLALFFLLATVEPAGVNPHESIREQATNWWEPFILKPREIIRAVPVMGTGTAAAAVDIPKLTLEEPAPKVKGIYLTSWKAGDRQFVEKLVHLMKKTGLNAVVLDVKDDTGSVSYPSGVTLAREIGAAIRKYQPAKLLELFQSNRIYPIARIVVFKDPLLANARNDLAVKSSKGGLWQDRNGLRWVDPYQKTVWEYNVELAKEAARLGFKEIQFDYVRFTSDGPIKECLYPAADNRAKAEVIRDFLSYACQELSGLGVKISADVFGLTCSAKDDMGIGQVFADIAGVVDVICPMVYPSHYYPGTYQLSNPDLSPYETVLQSLTDAKQKVAQVNNKKVIIRPWLQDFSLQSVYKAKHLKAQVKAVYDAGLEEWIFWNPSNKYEAKKYRFNKKINPKEDEE
ncbi:MAG TPA: putative glycoside hydrolase [Bacillota bacterium]|nr:putative glycoside hydrolase [Bacillota bacterium]